MLTNLGQKGHVDYFCKNCNFKTSHKSKYDRHLDTRKHKLLTCSEEKGTKPLIVCDCGKNYKYRQSLSMHKKKCTFIKNSENSENNENIINSNQELIKSEVESISESIIIKELKDIILQQQNQINKQQEQISELIPKIGNNNTNIQNNKFNINVFLNEQCKDAINISDFIKSIKITFEQLDFTNKKGLADGLSKSIIDNMNKLSIYQRPMHCTDVKRETLYIKDEDSWSKDKSKEKIKGAIKKASSKNFNALMDWKMSNPDYMNSEDKTDYFTKTISTIGKPSSSIDEKVIKNLCKETYVKNSDN
jgi:uncharacterized coiled-coil protein SlyX